MEIPQEIREKIAEFGSQFGTASAILAGFAITYLLVARGLRTFADRGHLPQRMVTTLRRIAAWVLLVGAVGFLLQSLGILESVFTAIAGFTALIAIGFVAVWSVLSNTLCSFILLIVRPFRVGDSLRFPPDDLGGRVVNFNMLFTTLETDEGGLLQVPNNMFFQRPIVRKKGKQRLEIDEQLYRAENARLDIEARRAGTDNGSSMARSA